MKRQLEEVDKFKDQNERRKFYKAIDNLKKGRYYDDGRNTKELLCTEQQDEDKERERDESDQEEPRIRRGETEEGEEANTPTCEEIAECIKKPRTIKHQEKTV
jgi:hypothetical protein